MNQIINEVMQWGWLLLLTWALFKIADSVIQLQKLKMEDLRDKLIELTKDQK